MKFQELWSGDAGEHVLALEWSPDSRWVAVVPSAGPIGIYSAHAKLIRELPGDFAGNGLPAWRGREIVTCGLSGKAQLWNPEESDEALKTLKPARGIISRVEWNVGRTHLALAQGPALHVFDTELSPTHTLPCPTTTDLCWNPCKPNEIAASGGQGAHMWRLGEEAPFAKFEWGGASMSCRWSGDGRWLATADQTPSIHLFDFSRHEPLHIQGYPTKVRAFAFSPDSTILATASAEDLTLWTCTGKRGPENTTPLQPPLHSAEIETLAFHPTRNLLASGDINGRLLLSLQGRPLAAMDADSSLTALGWSPDGKMLAAGDSDGAITLLALEE